LSVLRWSPMTSSRKTGRGMGSSAEQRDLRSGGTGLTKREFLNHEPHEPHERWRWVVGVDGFVAPPPDPRLRRAFPAPPSRAASGRGRLSRQAWNASPSSASIWRLGLWAVHPLHQKDPAPWTFAWSSSRTPVSEWGSAEQARLQSGDLRSSPGTRPRTGRRVSVAYGDAATRPRPWPRARAVRVVRVVSGRTSFGAPSSFKRAPAKTFR
jgi:hypothetical protein